MIHLPSSSTTCPIKISFFVCLTRKNSLFLRHSLGVSTLLVNRYERRVKHVTLLKNVQKRKIPSDTLAGRRKVNFS